MDSLHAHKADRDWHFERFSRKREIRNSTATNILYLDEEK
jgi:hypothetical protein